MHIGDDAYSRSRMRYLNRMYLMFSRLRSGKISYSVLLRDDYFFSAGGGGGGGTGLSSSGLLGAVPSPTCSQGDKASKFLCVIR